MGIFSYVHVSPENILAVGFGAKFFRRTLSKYFSFFEEHEALRIGNDKIDIVLGGQNGFPLFFLKPLKNSVDFDLIAYIQM